MVTKTFPTSVLEAMRFGDGEDYSADYSVECIQDSIVDQSRWSTFHEYVFRDLKTNKLYSVTYESGSTEMQEDIGFESDFNGMTECVEVKPVEVTKIVYEPI